MSTVNLSKKTVVLANDKIGRKCPKKTLTGQIYLSILIFMLKVKRFTANLHFFKICLEEIIVVRKTIDMSRLDKLKIDGEVANYLVQWDNTLLLTAYDQNRMFVLTIDGEQLLIRERLKDVLSRFAQANLIYP